MQKIKPALTTAEDSCGDLRRAVRACVWHDGTALDAALHYADIFPNARLVQPSDPGSAAAAPPVAMVQLGTTQLMLLNGGPHFRPNQTISMYVRVGSRALIDQLWAALSQNSPRTYLALGRYDWSPYYGWLADAWGFTWQLSLDESLAPDAAPVFAPSLLFSGDHYGQGAAALARYADVLPGGDVERSVDYPDGPQAGKMMFAELVRPGSSLKLMDGPGEHTFSEGVSLVVPCADQAELDRVWNGLIAGGGAPGRCGWLKDPFGVSWQVVPTVLGELLADPARAEARMQALQEMAKLDIAALEAAG